MNEIKFFIDEMEKNLSSKHKKHGNKIGQMKMGKSNCK